MSWPIWLTSNRPADGARPQMLGDDALILDRHRIAGERHHAAAAGAVPAVEREGSVRRRRSSIRLQGASVRPRRAAGSVPMPPLSRDLRAFPAVAEAGGLTPSVARLAEATADAFQSVLTARSFCLRDSGAVAPSAAARHSPARHALPRVHGESHRRDGPALEPTCGTEPYAARRSDDGSSAWRCSAAGPRSARSRAAPRNARGRPRRGPRDRPSGRPPHWDRPARRSRVIWRRMSSGRVAAEREHLAWSRRRWLLARSWPSAKRRPTRLTRLATTLVLPCTTVAK